MSLIHAPRLALTLFVIFCSAMVVRATDFDGDDTVNFRGSDVSQGFCSLDPFFKNRGASCIKTIVDPPPLSGGTVILTATPADRIGQIVGVNYLNGYDGSSGGHTLSFVDAMGQEISLNDFLRLPPEEQKRSQYVSAVTRVPFTFAGGPDPASDVLFTIEFLDLDPDGPETQIVISGEGIKGPSNEDRTSATSNFSVLEPRIRLEPEDIVPPSPELGPHDPFGFATIVINNDTNEVTFSGEFHDLTSFPDSVFIHGPALEGETAPILTDRFSFELDPNEFLGGRISGTFDGSGMFSEQQITDLRNGRNYVELQTANNNQLLNGRGEIRGQQIPEPESMVLTVIAGCMVGCSLRRRRTNSIT